MDGDYYRVLGLPRVATTSEIKARYKQLAKRYHPDHEGDTATMSRINQAYQVLADPRLRFEYNKTVFAHQETPLKAKPASQNIQQNKTSYQTDYPRNQIPRRRPLSSLIFSPIGAVIMLLLITIVLSVVHETGSKGTVTLDTSGSPNSASAAVGNSAQSPTSTTSVSSLGTVNQSAGSAINNNYSLTGPSQPTASGGVNAPSCLNQVSTNYQQASQLEREITITEMRLSRLASGQGFGGDYISNGATSRYYDNLYSKLQTYESELDNTGSTNANC
jgi:curved DNA-binding protein CbpA